MKSHGGDQYLRCPFGMCTSSRLFISDFVFTQPRGSAFVLRPASCTFQAAVLRHLFLLSSLIFCSNAFVQVSCEVDPRTCGSKIAAFQDDT